MTDDTKASARYDQVQEYMVFEKNHKLLIIAQAHARVLVKRLVKESKVITND